MNRENAHLYLPLVHALKDGYTLQHSPNNNDTWYDGDSWSFGDPPEYYRVKPKTIRIGAFDVPEPLRVAPTNGTRYYFPAVLDDILTKSHAWFVVRAETRSLAKVLCHLTKEAAELHALALISLTQTPTVQP